MIGTRHEEYQHFKNGLPFVLNANINRSDYIRSKEENWHEDLEIQLCTEGCGTVVLDGEKYPFRKNDIAVVGSNVLHYTGTDSHLTYSCLIISADYCRQVGIDPDGLCFSPVIQQEKLADLFVRLTEIYSDPDIPWRKPKLNQLLLEILTELAEHHSVKQTHPGTQAKMNEAVRTAISYIRTHYQQRITLDELSKAALYDKYALCRDFKRLTGQTIVENLNNYRCIRAMECLSQGYTVAETAALCGFENLSFFTKTFKRYIGKLPSAYKK